MSPLNVGSMDSGCVTLQIGEYCSRIALTPDADYSACLCLPQTNVVCVYHCSVFSLQAVHSHSDSSLSPDHLHWSCSARGRSWRWACALGLVVMCAGFGCHVICEVGLCVLSCDM